MKAEILNLDGSKKGDIELPKQFSEEYRPDLIKRAVIAIQSHNRQSTGTAPKAGTRPSAKTSKRRRKYRGSYGKGISRVPRKVLSRHGTQFSWTGAFAPGTVGGRRAHPPKAEEDFALKINTTERKKAIRSAIAATSIKEIVVKRGHKLSREVPIVLDSAVEDIKKTSEATKMLTNMGMQGELKRLESKKVRAGRGKSRGRKYSKKKGPLFVVSGKCSLQKSASNIPGVDIISVESLNAELLAPGTHPGRLTIWSEKALGRMAKERLFMRK
ncbi:MAG: 50S ribosomal protein L4 [Candidatus Woesearchaeota archaeon]